MKVNNSTFFLYVYSNSSSFVPNFFPKSKKKTFIIYFFLLLIFIDIPSRAIASPSLACGESHSLALASDGTLWAWGKNNYGQLGDGTQTSTLTPIQVGSDFVAIAAGDNHSLALKADGTLWAWGSNDNFQIGDGTYDTTPRLSPVQIGTGFTAIAAGGVHSFALKSDGTPWAWGDNYYGQFGVATPMMSNSPMLVGSELLSVATGMHHTFYIKADGTLWSSGANWNGQLGDGTTTQHKLPVEVDTNFISCSAGRYFSLGLKSDGTLWAWGDNYYGQLGDGTYTTRLSPIQVGTDFATITAGFYYSLALKTDGTLWGWGMNASGQIGDGTWTTRVRPVQVGTNFTTMSASKDHSLGLKADGSLWAWGANDSGQLGDGTETNRLIPIQVLGENGVGFLNLLDGSIDYALLFDGDKLNNLAAAAGKSLYYKLEIPDDVQEVYINSDSGDGDLDIYIFNGLPPNDKLLDYSIGNDNNENIILQSPPPGTIYIRVEAFQSFSGANFNVQFSKTTIDIVDPNSTSVTGINGSGGMVRYFKYTLQHDQPWLSFRLHPGQGSCEIGVNYQLRDNAGYFDYYSSSIGDNSIVSIKNAKSGDYYISLVGLTDYYSSNLDILPVFLGSSATTPATMLLLQQQ